MPQDTQEKLAHVRALIVRLERRIKRTANALHKYRLKEARLVRKASGEVKAASAPVKAPRRTVARKIDLS